MKKVALAFKTYIQSGTVDAADNRNSITFINNGTVTVTINNSITLAVGASLAIEGNEGEIDVTKYDLQFESGNLGSLVVITKSYV